MILHDDPLCTLHLGDCVEVMRELPAESVDAVVTDPPYGLEFMGKEWDRLQKVPEHSGPQWGGYGWHGSGRNDPRPMQAWHEAWAREAFRVAKPGAHLLAFGGTRTYHRLASAIEDAGWEIRDCLVWAYASGFPKSLNFPDGFGTALKPAWEPIVMARRPLVGTVAANRAAHGTGALNIDATRIGTEQTVTLSGPGKFTPNAYANGKGWDAPIDGEVKHDAPGRWPANLLLTDEVLGEYSRFFTVPKSSRSDREPLVRGEPVDYEHSGPRGHSRNGDGTERASTLPRANSHPTVKPLDLMRHLVRLVTPPGGTVLDPFLGSGTTAIAANAEGFRCIGIEKEREYLDITLARMTHQPLGMQL